MRILDSGHKYELLVIDGDVKQELTFVKRCDLNNPDKYPGNFDSYPGTTIQSVTRCLVDRVLYLQNQKPCLENILITLFLKLSIWLLEFRAARRHKMFYCKSPNYATYHPLCEVCGHTFCEHVA